MAKNQITLDSNMMKITLGYSTLLLDWKSGMLVMQALENARFVASTYENSKYVWKFAVDSAVHFESFSPECQAQLLMSPAPEVV